MPVRPSESGSIDIVISKYLLKRSPGSRGARLHKIGDSSGCPDQSNYLSCIINAAVLLDAVATRMQCNPSFVTISASGIPASRSRATALALARAIPQVMHFDGFESESSPDRLSQAFTIITLLGTRISTVFRTIFLADISCPSQHDVLHVSSLFLSYCSKYDPEPRGQHHPFFLLLSLSLFFADIVLRVPIKSSSPSQGLSNAGLIIQKEQPNVILCTPVLKHS